MADTPINNKPSIWPNYSATNVKKAADSGSSELGKDQFLKILITQLKNQDPMQPMQDKEFIAQMAQFTAVEQMTSMAEEMRNLRQSLGMASGLIGKNIGWTVTDSGGKTFDSEGLVDSITFKEGKQYANVDGTEVLLDKITKIWNAGNAE